MVADTCAVCKKLLKSKVVTYEGKNFCCQMCCGRFKKSQKKKVCEFC